MKVKSIFKKSMRSMWRNKGSYISCIIVLSIGLLVFISMLSILSQIQNGISTYYEKNRFGDAFANIISMPKSELKKLESISGIDIVDGHLSKMVRASIGNADEIINIKLVGVYVDNQEKINQYTYEGEKLKYNNDIWIGKAFLNAHNLQQGDSIPLLINGKEESFTVQGVVESPEYITVISDTALMPDDKTYTIGFIRAEALENYTASYGIITDVSFLFDEGVKYDDIEKSLDDTLSKYGLLNLVSRDNQKSNYYIVDEISQITIIGTILPIIFLVISFIMLYIMLKRLIEQERSEIGTFKAFGFGNFEVASGYIFYGVIVGLLGFAFGFFLSEPFGTLIYSIYQEMYSLPDPQFIKSSSMCMYALAVSLFVSVFSVLVGANSILRIKPAEAMRVEAPKTSNSHVNFDNKFFNFIFNKSGIMALRGIMRNKTRSILIILSVVAAFTLINGITAFKQSIDDTIITQPSFVEFYDIKIELNTTKPTNDVLAEVKKIDGVVNAEAMLTLPVQLIYKNSKEDIIIYGVSENSAMYKIRGMDGTFHEPPKNGIILNTKMAEKLKVKSGDIVEIKSPYLQVNEKLIVLNIFEEAIGSGCYMEAETLSNIFFKKPMTNSILIKSDNNNVSNIQKTIAQFPNISDIYNQERVLEVNKKFVESVVVMIYALIIMSFFMGFSAIYNVSRISLAEKQRELATMRIIGYRIDETAAMNSFEQWIMLVVGIIVGFIPTNLLKDYLGEIFSSDYFTLKVHITIQSTIVAVLCCVLSVLLSNFAAKREIKRYELAEVLKERE